MGIPLYKLYEGRLDRKGYLIWSSVIAVAGFVWVWLVSQMMFGADGARDAISLQVISLPVHAAMIGVSMRRLQDLNMPRWIAYVGQGVIVLLALMHAPKTGGLMNMIDITPIDMLSFVFTSLYTGFLLLMPSGERPYDNTPMPRES